MMNPCEDIWGRNPVNDRDWGLSESCESGLIDELTRRLNANQRDTLKADIFVSTPSVSETATASLSSDFEAASGYHGKPDRNVISGDKGIDEYEPYRVSVHNSSSVVFEVPHVEHNGNELSRDDRRRQTSFAKHRRISLFAAAINPAESFLRNRKSLFIQSCQTIPSSRLSLLHEGANAFYPSRIVPTDEIPNEPLLEDSPLNNNDILQTVFDFLDQNELLYVASLVSTKWFDAATRSHANQMLLSVGCGSEQKDVEGGPGSHAVREFMQRPWIYMTTTFPWACFLSEGAYKRVYKVFNHFHRVEEAISVM
jgi:hypothetical protein